MAEANRHSIYHTIGGAAVSLIAQPRATKDVDAVVWVEPEGWRDLLTKAKHHGFVPRLSDALEFARRSRVLLLKHQATGISLDMSLGALPFEEEMIARADTLNIGRISLRIATPEDLIITKAVAARPQDIADIQAIINAHPQFDKERIFYWLTQFAEALEDPTLTTRVETLFEATKS